MKNTPDSAVYKGMTAGQLAELFDDTLMIPDFYALLQENREKAQIIADKLNPIRDVAYGPEKVQKLDIYSPENAKQLPVLIDIHGGGWTAGSKNSRSIPAETLMSADIIWVPIDYGLAPDYSMQEMIAHVRTALVWIYGNIAAYGGNPERLYISGQSAGAHLAATATMPDWQAQFKVPANIIKGMIALSGIYDLEGLLHAPQTEIRDMLKLDREEAREFSPLNHLPGYSFPAIIAYGTKEPLAYFREAKDYATALESCDSEVCFLAIPDANHFDMINALSADINSILFKSTLKMINKDASDL